MVELTAELPTHTIRYTTNERVPTVDSTLYMGPISISATTNLRAIAVSPDGEISTVVSRSYIELASSVVDVDSNLPIVIVDTFGDSVPGTGSNFGDGAFIAIIEPGEDGRARLDGSFDLTTRGGLHVRGSSSSGFAKKQYRVEFWDEQNEDQKQEVLGMPKEADWIFYAPNQYDRALVSNPLMYDLSNQIGRYATRTRWVEMYLNRSGTVSTSDYVGVYAIMEVIEAGKDRVDVGDLSTGAGGQPVEGGFVWKNDRGSEFVDPDPANSRQRTYIRSFVNGLTSAARSANRGDPETGYEAWADVPSFIDHNLLNLFAMNVDALRLSSFYHKTPDGKFAAGPIWDFDRSLDSTDGRDNNPRSWFGTGDSTRYFDDNSRVRSWWPDMAKDPDFVQKYVDRWAELRQNEFSLESINATIDKHADEIGEAADRDYDKWNIRDRFSSEISQMKSWIRRRVEWIDDQWLAAPGFSINTPQVAPGTGVSLTSTTGDVYYTLDGSDPRGDNGVIRPEAIKATGPIVINGLTTITARVYKQGHAPSRNPGYTATGDDWSAPVRETFFNDAPATAGTLAITEVNYNPFGATAIEEGLGFDDNDDFEFIELMNIGNEDIVLSGASLTQIDSEGVSFEFSNGEIQKLAPGDRMLVVENVDAFEARYGGGLPVAGQWSGSLSNNNEMLTVSAFDDSIIHQFRYNDGGSWPALADGVGASLELIGDSADANEPFAWAASVTVGGTPGSNRVDPIGVVVNEIIAHTDLPLSDSIELLNTTSSAINIGGWYLSDSANDLLKFEIPAGTVLEAGDYIVFTETDFNPNPEAPLATEFALSSSRGDEVWLTIADQSGLLPQTFVDSVEFPATRNGESMGRVPNGTGDLFPLQANTFGAANSAPRVGPVVFSEIHYSPNAPSVNAIILFPELVRDDLEYVEIHNPTPNAIDLTNWRIRGGVDYNFDDGAVLPANGTLLIISFEPNKAENTDRYIAFREHHGLAPDSAVVGGYSGQLNDSGETIRLESPDQPPAEDPDLIPRLWEDVVEYSTDAAWPNVSNNGSSLNRIAATAFGSAPEGWTGGERTPTSYSSVDADFNNDGIVNVADIDLGCSGIHSGNLRFDFNGDGIVDESDLNQMVSGIFFTGFGDSNLDGVFNSTDLIVVFQAGEYEDVTLGNSMWSEGDWNCDSEFDSGDLVQAFQAGAYSANATIANQPNPTESHTRDDAFAAATHDQQLDSPETKRNDRPRVTVENRRAAALDVARVDAVFDLEDHRNDVENAESSDFAANEELI